MSIGWEAAAGRLGPGADWYARAGWKVFPCYGIVGGKCTCGSGHVSPKDNGKHPHGRLVSDGMVSATDDAETVAGWWREDPEANIGVRCRESGFIVVDIDPRNGGLESWDRLESMTGGAMTDTVEAWTGEYTTPGGSSRGRHLFYRVTDGEALKPGVPGLKGIDVKHNGYVLINPSRHASGLIYEWRPGHAPWERAMAEAPEELLELVRKRAPRTGGAEYGVLEWGGEKIDVDAILEAGIPEGERVNTLYPIACAFANQYPVGTAHGEASVKQIMRAINEKYVSPPLDWDDELEFQVRRAIEFVKENPKEKLFAESLAPGLLDWVNDQRAQTRMVEKPAPASRQAETGSGSAAPAPVMTAMPAVADDTLPPDMDEFGDDTLEPDGAVVVRRTLTDRGNARRLRDHYRGTVRYTPGMGWFIWNGAYWEPDDEGLGVLEKAQVVSRLISREMIGLEPGDEEWKKVTYWATQSKNTGKLRSAIDQWKADSEHTKTPVSAWDSNPYYLGVKNGVIDLRTGELLVGTLEMGITKRTEVAYTPGMRNIRWEQFLDFATGGDKELQGWLQKAAGYTLTGLRDHDVLFMVYGQPGSGKSTFLEAIGHVLGKDYSVAMNSAVLVDDGMKSSSDEYHWAQLRGKRMVVFSEWPQGKKTKEDAVKRLTGDMTIQARHPGERPFNFESQAKLWLGTNIRPQIHEEAMWRRIRAIPFPYVPTAPDPGLKPYLMDPEGGLPAVVSWAVEGAVRLINSPERDSLGWCAAVAEASAEYKKQEDRMGIFLEEETVASEGATVPVKILHDVHRMWSEDRGEKPMTATPFRKALEERGLRVTGIGRRAVLEGRQLLPRIAEPAGAGPDWADLARWAR